MCYENIGHFLVIYCATSIIDGLEVDHVFEVKTDNEAIKFAEKNGWYFAEIEVEVELTPWKPRVVH